LDIEYWIQAGLTWRDSEEGGVRRGKWGGSAARDFKQGVDLIPASILQFTSTTEKEWTCLSLKSL